MRLAIPNLDQEEQIHQTGIGLINLLGVDLFNSINLELEAVEGVDWLTRYRKSSLVYLNYNFNDPSNLLKELLRVSSSPLRNPIKKVIPAKEIVAFFNRLGHNMRHKLQSGNNNLGESFLKFVCR